MQEAQPPDPSGDSGDSEDAGGLCGCRSPGVVGCLADLGVRVVFLRVMTVIMRRSQASILNSSLGGASRFDFTRMSADKGADERRSGFKAAHLRRQAKCLQAEIPVVKIREDRSPGADLWAALSFGKRQDGASTMTRHTCLLGALDSYRCARFIWGM